MEVGGGPYEVHPVLCGGTDAMFVADEVTNVIVNGVGVPGVIVAWHGAMTQDVFDGIDVGHTSWTVSPSCPKTLSGTTCPLNTAVPPCVIVSSICWPLASCRL